MIANRFLYKLDPAAFAREQLNFHPDEWQSQVLRWNGGRLLMNCSRQSGKSTVAAILGLHRAMHFSSSLVLLVSPSLRQSSELFRKIIAFVEQLETRPRLIEDNKLSLAFENKSRIVSLPSSEDTVRGYSGVNLLILDEASRIPDPLYIAVRPMVAVSGGKIICLSTPFGRRGFYFEEWENGGTGWARVKVPATECQRISKGFLEEERKSLGELWYKSEYLCMFEDSVASLFNTELLMKSFSKEVKPLFSKEVTWPNLL